MKYLTTLLLALFTFGASAQVDSTENQSDTIQSQKTEIDFGNVKVIVKDKKKIKSTKDSIQNIDDDDYEDERSYPQVNFETSFGIGVAGFSEVTHTGSVGTQAVTSTASLDLDYGKCRNYMINGNLSIDITKNFGILTGVGFEFNRYVFRENLQVTPKDGHFVSDSITSFSSYKFKTNYVQLPLMLKFQNNSESFKFAIGGTFSYNIGNKVKYEFSDQDADYKTTIKGNYNVAPIKLSVGARIAYKGIGLYVNYGLTEMNKDFLVTKNGFRDLMPFSAGITLGGL
ncbi:MAG: outer membrane beta-barrel protein [Flavobacteriales bacterium]